MLPGSYEKTEVTSLLKGDRLLPIRAVAERLRVGTRTIRNYVAQGLLRAIHLPGGLRFRVADVVEFEKQRWG